MWEQYLDYFRGGGGVALSFWESKIVEKRAPLKHTVIVAQQRATCKVLHQKLLLGALVTKGHKNVSVGAT